MTTVVLMLFATSVVASLVLTGLLVRIGQNIGTLDSAGFEGHDKTLRDVPNIGGIAIWSTLVLPHAAGLITIQAKFEAQASVM